MPSLMKLQSRQDSVQCFDHQSVCAAVDQELCPARNVTASSFTAAALK